MTEGQGQPVDPAIGASVKKGTNGTFVVVGEGGGEQGA